MKNLISIRFILFFLYFLLIVLLFPESGNLFKFDSAAKIDTKEPKDITSTIKNISLSDDAPDIKNNSGKWINTDNELTLHKLKGKVILIEFWTFGCYNCKNTLPYLNNWYEKYKSEKFVIIGIHCPEFDKERNFENVKESVEDLGIKYPVLTDNEFSVWKKFDVHAWPTIFLIDKNGALRYKKVGEGKYDEIEHAIIELLNENYSPEKNN